MNRPKTKVPNRNRLGSDADAPVTHPEPSQATEGAAAHQLPNTDTHKTTLDADAESQSSDDRAVRPQAIVATTDFSRNNPESPPGAAPLMPEPPNATDPTLGVQAAAGATALSQATPLEQPQAVVVEVGSVDAPSPLAGERATRASTGRKRRAVQNAATAGRPHEGRVSKAAGKAASRETPSAATAESSESADNKPADGGEGEDLEEVATDVAEVVPTEGLEDDAGGEVIDATVELVDEPVAGGEFEAPPQSVGALTRLDPMQQYLREIQRHSLLTPDEEHALAVKYVQTADVIAARRLVTANLRLVVKLAYEYRRAYKNIMDLVQEGNIGLMQAVKRYDPYRGVKLSSYAAWWIRAYILRFILNNWRLVKLGTTQAQRKLFFNLNKEKARLSAMGIEPSHAEIAVRLGVEEQEVSDMDRRLSSGEMSLDAPVGDNEGRPVSRLEMMPTMASGPDMAVADGEIAQMVKAKLADFRLTLKGKDIEIFDERLVAEDPLTLQELGDKFGISRERVRQLEARLTGRLREFLKSELGDAVVG